MSTKTETADAVIIERILNAPVARVWKALTDVEQMREWFLPCWRRDEWSGPKFKPQVGFEFEFVVEHKGNSYHHLCKVTEVIPKKRSLTPGAIKVSQAIRWSRLNCRRPVRKQN